VTYLDSSAVIKLYYFEENTTKVSTFVRSLGAAIPFSHLHGLEIRNSLRLKVFRRESSAAQLKAALSLIDEDLESGMLLRPTLSWVDVFRHAEALSRRYSRVLGSRSLDLLHVASCVLLEAEDFLTFDDRQGVLARKAGLNLITL
jgi:predicted nucleic acid-binding protein